MCSRNLILPMAKREPIVDESRTKETSGRERERAREHPVNSLRLALNELCVLYAWRNRWEIVIGMIRGIDYATSTLTSPQCASSLVNKVDSQKKASGNTRSVPRPGPGTGPFPIH